MSEITPNSVSSLSVIGYPLQQGIDSYAAYHGGLYDIRPLDVVANEGELLQLAARYQDHMRVRL